MARFCMARSAVLWGSMLQAVACSGSSARHQPSIAVDPASVSAADVVPRAELEAFAARLERKRRELGIPGMALVVVKGDSVVYSSGHGLRDVERQLPVTEHTLFAIGSTTKAFTAMLVMMAQEAGKLELESSPKTCVPYFKLKDAEADAKITIRDLLTHTSGLMRMDLGWITGKLSNEEVIRMAGEAEPVAKLGQSFNYQNVMYLAAGECVARTMGMSYEDLLHERILKPLHMTDSNLSVARALKTGDHATGYAQFGPDRQVRSVPMRPIDHVAPAGALNASIHDLANWLRLWLGRGELDGKRLVNEASYKALTKGYVKVGPGHRYALGWMEGWYRGKREYSHGGGIDGFVTLISFLPKEKVGFALLTNIANGDIQGFVTDEVYGMFAGLRSPAEGGATAKQPSTASVEEAGTYGFLGGLKVQVTWETERLWLQIPNQSKIGLESEGGRRYRMGSPLPAGYFVTFRQREGTPESRELTLEQPGFVMVMPHLSDEDIQAAAKLAPPAELVELLGSYAIEGEAGEMQIEAIEGQVSLVVTGQPTYPLQRRQDDRFGLTGLPEEFGVEVRRNDKGQVEGLVLQQPNRTVELRLVARGAPPVITVDQLWKKVRKAAGVAAVRRRKSIAMRRRLDMIHQGITGIETVLKERDKMRSDTVLFAVGKEIGMITASWDGYKARQQFSTMPEDELPPGQSDLIRLEAAIDPVGNWQRDFASVRIVRSSKIGDQDVVIVEKTTHGGATLLDAYSVKSYLLLRRETTIPVGFDGQRVTETQSFSDYRSVGGIMVPHRIESETLHGKVHATVESVTFDAPTSMQI